MGLYDLTLRVSWSFLSYSCLVYLFSIPSSISLLLLLVLLVGVVFLDYLFGSLSGEGIVWLDSELLSAIF